MKKQLLRTRKFSNEIAPVGGDGGDWAQGYKVGNLVFLQGQAGLPLDGQQNVSPGDPAGQVRQALENIKALMKLAGGDLSDIVRIVVYTTERDYRKVVYPVIDEYFPKLKPCSTGLVVKGLATEDLLVEIDAYGVIDDPAEG